MASFGYIKVPFRDMSLGALNEPRSALHGPYYCCLCNDGMALGASFGFLDTEHDVGCRVFIDYVRACWAVSKRNATWLILLVVICLSQRLSNSCVYVQVVDCCRILVSSIGVDFYHRGEAYVIQDREFQAL
ncbi:hypothetical protein L2E82_23077 [Cichorium intybus]|uniref:Uncharacterized protein n=1 Tax=Cichorium intybus TaxID=13427 RepID=A0ACB9DZI9_CICIN|nr:hypothetical protein L2E82_23077 [Cichorium intybus]